LARTHVEPGQARLSVSHDLAAVADLGEEVAVMYAGRVVERGPLRLVFARPAHPYTAALLRCAAPTGAARGALPTIPGALPAPDARPSGCRFRDRCERADAKCLEDPPLAEIAGRQVACWHPWV